MKRILLVSALILTSVFTFGQQRRSNSKKEDLNIAGTVSGKVVDSSSKKPVEYANISIFSSKDSSIITGAVSNENGIFEIKNVPPGQYYAKVSFIGFATKTIKNIKLDPKNNGLQIGTIDLKASSIKLGAVVVKGKNDMIVTNLDKQVINVGKDLQSAGGTALDVMQNIPALTVDIDGNISLMGSSNVTILVDGKPTGMAGLNSSDVLTSIPASSIKSVEVVTNPSAKYDPDGTAGIINIVLKKKSNLGFNGILNLNAGTGTKYTGGTNFNYRTGDINLFGDLSGRMFDFNRTGLTDRTSFFDNSTSYLDQSSNGGYNMYMGNVNVGLDYLLDDNNTLSFSTQFRQFHMKNSGDVLNSQLNDVSSLENYFVNSSEANRMVKATTYSLDYKRDFDNPQQKWTADAMYTTVNMNSASGTNYNYYITNGSPSSDPASLINNTYNNFHHMLIFQSDYIQPLGKHNRLDVGIKSSISELGMDYNFFNFDPAINLWINNAARSNNFDYKEQIHAIYGIYTGSFGNFQYEGGIRGEYDGTNAQLINNGISFNRHYTSLYPSAYLAYQFTPLEQFKISYSRRVDRPRPWQINPFINYSDSLNLTYGNPSLAPQYTNSYEMGYSTIFFDFNLYSSLFLKQTSGMITQISNMINNGITETTYQNIASENNYGIEVIANGSLFPWWKLNANASYFRADINDPVYITGTTSNYSYSWTGRINSTWDIDKTLALQLTSTYYSPVVRPQGKTNAIYFTDIALKKEFWNGKLSVNLRLSDIFNTMKYASETYGNGFTMFNTGRRDSRIFYLGITYNLNDYKQQPDQNKIKDINLNDEINND